MSDSPVAELLRDFREAAAEGGNRWFLFGAQAVSIYGRPRTTADVDISVELGDEPTGRFADRLARRHFRVRVPDIDDFVARTRVLPLVHDPTGLPTDVVLTGPGLEEEFLANARDVDLGLGPIPVIAAEDLLVTKILAGRERDLEDVRNILRENDRLDLARTRYFLGLLEQALSRADLLPQFERLVSAPRRPPRG